MSFPVLFICAFVLLLAVSCSNPLNVDISASNYHLESVQLDSILKHTPNEKLPSEIETLEKKYPEIIDYQFYYCFKTGLPKDSAFALNWLEFTRNSYYKRLSKRIDEQFATKLPQSRKLIEDGFKRLQVHLPNSKLPESVIFMDSYFASSVYCTEKEIGIGLERYLGAKTDVIRELPGDVFYEWIKKAMEPQYLERDAVCGWVLTHICEPGKDFNNIQAMIQWGKILYLTRAALPGQKEHTLLRYSEKEYDWALRNERNFWEYLVKQNILFVKSETDQAAFLQEAPFTARLPQKGPDRLGQFLGYRIVCSYMEQYDITLQELIGKPYNEILTEYQIND